MRGLIFALRFLTRLPIPSAGGFRVYGIADSAPWFPVVGAIVGLLVAIALFLGAKIDVWVGALFAILTWVWVTGGMHIDGLADVADALAASHRHPERMLAVMREPHVGSFAVMSVVLLMLSKLVLLMLLARLGEWWVLIFISAWARLGAVLWAKTLPSLGSGLGESLSAFSLKALLLPYFLLIGLTGFFKPSLLAAPVALFLWWMFLKRKVGGMNGDCLGAGVEVSEALMLFFAILY